MNIDVNRFTMTGRIAKAPELLVTETGDPYCPLRVAVGRMRKDHGKVPADFFTVVFFGDEAKKVAAMGWKGKPVYLEGSFRSRPNGVVAFVGEHFRLLCSEESPRDLRLREERESKENQP